MRKVLGFLVWLFSLWTWKDFFLRWLRRPSFYPASGETAGSEHLASEEGHTESEFARFLSSLSEDERWCGSLVIDDDSSVELQFGPNWKSYKTDTPAGYDEFLRAVPSSEVVFHEEVTILLRWDDSFKLMEAFGDAIRQSGSAIKKLYLRCSNISAIPIAKCVSSVLLGNDALGDLDLFIYGLKENMGKDLATQFMDILSQPHILRILKSFMFCDSNFDDEGMKQLMKPFNSLDNALEELYMCNISSSTQLEHISGLLAVNTSLKILGLDVSDSEKMIECTRGYTNIAFALCSNRSLQDLRCKISSSMELKALLDPLMPKTNNLQPNTTLTSLTLWGVVGGKEGIETLVAMLRTNKSLLNLRLQQLNELSFEDE